MRPNKNILLIVLIIVNIMGNTILAQDLSTLTTIDRNKKLIEIANSVYKAPYIKHFYREYGKPTITESKLLDKFDGIDKSKDSKSFFSEGREGQKYYIVYFHYDMSKERFDEPFAASVYIWENTGKAFAITLGNGIMLPVRNGKIPKHDNQPPPLEYYTITYSKDVPNANLLPKKAKYGDIITLSLLTTVTESYDGWTTEQGYNFNEDGQDITILSEDRKYFTKTSYNRIIKILVTGDTKVNVTKYQEEYETPY